MSFVILMGLELTVGLRVSEEQEEAGLDEALHKESIFDSQHGRRMPVKTVPKIITHEDLLKAAGTGTGENNNRGEMELVPISEV